MQTLKIICAVLSTLVSVVAFIPYFRDIFLKKTKPHAYTWLIWAITQGTAVAGLWYGKGGIGSLGLTVGASLVFIVFLLSLHYGTRKITRGDTLLLIAALIAILIWWQLHSALLAVLMVSVIDAVGYIPSYRKCWEEPWSETLLSWVLYSVSNIFAMLALMEYNLLTLTYLVTITILNSALVVICLIRRKKIAVEIK